MNASLEPTHIPALFPSVHIPDAWERALHSLFGSVLVLVPDAAPVDEKPDLNGTIFRAPFAGTVDPALLKNILARLKAFAGNAQGLDLARLRYIGAAGGHGETSHGISDAVRRGGAAPEPPDPDLAAAVFLHVARDLDLAQEEVENRFALASRRETEMFRSLGDTDGELPEGENPRLRAGQEEPPEMCRKRLAAWARLAARDTRLPPCLVTLRRDALEALLERFPSGILACASHTSSDVSAEWREKHRARVQALLARGKDALADLQNGPALVPGEGDGGLLKVETWFFPETSLDALFAAIAPPARLSGGAAQDTRPLIVFFVEVE